VGIRQGHFKHNQNGTGGCWRPVTGRSKECLMRRVLLDGKDLREQTDEKPCPHSAESLSHPASASLRWARWGVLATALTVSPCQAPMLGLLSLASFAPGSDGA
jgi:hypothetical protein